MELCNRPPRGKPCSVKKLIPSQGFPLGLLPHSMADNSRVIDQDNHVTD